VSNNDEDINIPSEHEVYLVNLFLSTSRRELYQNISAGFRGSAGENFDILVPPFNDEGIRCDGKADKNPVLFFFFLAADAGAKRNNKNQSTKTTDSFFHNDSSLHTCSATCRPSF